MNPRITLQSVALDILAGFVALCLLLVFLLISRTNNLQSFSLIASVLFFLAGMLRGRSAPQSPWLKALLIELGGAVPVMALRWTQAGFTAPGYVPLFIFFSLLLAVAGVSNRHLLSGRKARAASVLAMLTLGAAAFAMEFGVPPLLARWSSQKVDRPAPSFSLVTLDGKTVSSADLQGRVVVLAFWATWCVPCRQELPELQRLYAQDKQNSKVSFYAVGGPWGGDTLKKESAFAKQMKLDIPLAFASDETKQALGVKFFPSLIILGESGRIRMIHVGYDASEYLSGEVAKEVHALVQGRA